MKRRRIATAIRRFIAASIASLALVACKTLPSPPPGAATCADVCQRGAAMGCAFSRPTANGASCETVCLDVQRGGDFSLDLECRARATTCDETELCETER